MYCTLEDIKGSVPKERLIEITDDLNPTSTGDVVRWIVDKKIGEASDIINAYIGKRFRLPLPFTPSVIKSICVNITISLLYSRVTAMDIPEGIKLRYDEAVSFLKRIASGDMSLGIDEKEEGAVQESGFGICTAGGGESIFTMKSMRGL
jgi:phage gp36-like protein